MAARKKTTSSAKKPAAKKKAAPRSTKKFLRNLTGTEVSLRLERQERPKKRHELKPRGQRGDLVLLQKEDLSDPIVTENVALGVVEVITEAEAKEVIEQQSVNIQARQHPALGLLTNELGEKIETVVLEPPEGERGTVVATLEDGNLPSDGKGVNWDQIKRDPGLSDGTANKQSKPRTTAINPADVPSDGVVQAVSPEEVADARARSKATQSASDLGLTVTVEPTRKT